jgi:predicted NAD/FAD-binding protein
LLEEPSVLQDKLLSKFKYQKNIATLHTDESIMPQNRLTWSSWNYRIEATENGLQPSIIYWMNQLQGVSKKKTISFRLMPSLISTLPRY